MEVLTRVTDFKLKNSSPSVCATFTYLNILTARQISACQHMRDQILKQVHENHIIHITDRQKARMLISINLTINRSLVRRITIDNDTMIRFVHYTTHITNNIANIQNI